MPGKAMGKSSTHIDQLKESERQSAIFRSMVRNGDTVDLSRLRAHLVSESQIPQAVIDAAILTIQTNMDQLGLNNPSPSLIQHWLTGLLREQGYATEDLSLHTLELSLHDVELNIFHPLGSGGFDQNPEASSQRIAGRIKTQFACRRIFQEDVIAAHEEGHIELMHLGAIDRPHDVIVTPDYLKHEGLPRSSGAPSAGPARRADVMLGHLIRFSNELQNHFAGDIQWAYLNTLLLPYFDHFNDKEMAQFVQQLFYEFGQLDLERGGLYRKVILDLDFDMPRQLAGLPAIGPGGEATGKTYGDYAKTLERFNEITLDILDQGDFLANPFHSPLIVYHLNQPDTAWHHLHQKLFKIAMRNGNPSIAFSFYSRNFGPLGRLRLNDPDFLQMIQDPRQLRGFSSSSVALNLPQLARPEGEGTFASRLNRAMELVVTAHRQKRLFLSRLMAFGHRGPLQFLRHKLDGRPFLKIDRATQPLQLIGLAEAAAMLNGSPLSPADALTLKSEETIEAIKGAMQSFNQMHKLRMFFSATKSESVAYRFASLDMRSLGRDISTYILRQPGQAHPIYTEGANILAFNNLRWRDRMAYEGRAHQALDAPFVHTIYLEADHGDDATLCQKIYQEAQKAEIGQLQMAPDLLQCKTCNSIFDRGEACPSCKSSLIAPYGLCQTQFSPVHSWCLGKRSEWKLRHRMDTYRPPIQTSLFEI